MLVNKFNVLDAVPDIDVDNFMTSIKKQGVIWKVKEEYRPRKDTGNGTFARVGVSYFDLEDAIDRFTELVIRNDMYQDNYIKKLDVLFMVKGKMNEHKAMQGKDSRT